jgi:hypothetical protein
MAPYHSQAVLYPSPGRLATELNLSAWLLNLLASLIPTVSADGIKCARGSELALTLEALDEEEELEEDKTLEEDELLLDEEVTLEDKKTLEVLDSALLILP